MTLNDASARKAALTQLDKSLLVEAGAGSGKTSLMAGRIVSLLGSGVHPRNIAAVSFTEMAASELLTRVTEFTQLARDGKPPIDISAAFDGNVSPETLRNLDNALDNLGELTCTTIHGFCQRMLKPYPVEADMDPGAQILDPSEASLVFDDVFNEWIRDRLETEDEHLDIITEMVSREPGQGISAIKDLATYMRYGSDMLVDGTPYDGSVVDAFIKVSGDFISWSRAQVETPPDNDVIIEALEEMANALKAYIGKPDHSCVVNIACLDTSAIAKVSSGFKIYKMKGKWQKCAPSKAQGDVLNDTAVQFYDDCIVALEKVQSMAASAGLALLQDELKPLLERYQERKRSTAALDFEDLLGATRSLLNSNPDVRSALSNRYCHILVDEFQDTDPVQTEIFKHLAFSKSDDGEWTPKAGNIFLVGDPKQAIYRFRGADVKTYLGMRDIMERNDPSSILTVSTNFRSTKGVLDYVNDVFEDVLNDKAQPGFTALNYHRASSGSTPAIHTFNVEDHRVVSEAREQEARKVANLCAQLVQEYRVPDGKGDRPCTPADIALLAPTGSELWRYEHALENLGISVATQAGKGMFQRQEIHDLIALTRVLADERDTLALGALLRGPLVGLTEAELLDASEELPDDESGRLPFIRIGTATDRFSNPVLKDVLEKLNLLKEVALTTAPHEVLSLAVDELNVRPIMRLRYKNPDRALANIDRYLELSKPYSVRGLRSFSDAMRQTWEDGERMAEGRPDGETESVSLITMHSAKGLEWPIVITINTMTSVHKQNKVIVDVTNRRMTMPFMRLLPEGLPEAKTAADSEDYNERVRLWYVATTRARDLLVIPHHEKQYGNQKHWCGLVNLKIEQAAVTSVPDNAAFVNRTTADVENGQDMASFATETVRIGALKAPIKRISPSRHETSPMMRDELSADDIIQFEPVINPEEMKTGSPERGVVMHKLIEEILTGELEEDDASLLKRAEILCDQFRSTKADDLEKELEPVSMARQISQTLRIPEIQSMRSRLFPEIMTSMSTDVGGHENVTMGVIDAAEVMDDGRIRTIVDWKSDLHPTQSAIAHYRNQVRDYMKLNDTERGLIVFMSSGKVVEVT